MLNPEKIVVAKLKELGIPVEYELFTQTDTVPAISYQTIQNSETHHGNDFGYSDYRVRIKLWAKDLAQIDTLSQQLDDAMAEIYLYRANISEMKEYNIICRIFDYTGKLLDEYTNTRF